MASPAILLLLLATAGFVALLRYVIIPNRSAVAFFAVLMSVSATLAVVGTAMLIHGELAWQGVVLTCFGLTLLLATKVASLVLFRAAKDEARSP